MVMRECTKVNPSGYIPARHFDEIQTADSPVCLLSYPGRVQLPDKQQTISDFLRRSGALVEKRDLTEFPNIFFDDE